MVFRDPQQFNPSPHADASADPAAGPRDVGLVFIGDSLVAGYGDPKGLGWVSRVVARTQHPDLDLTSYNLGIRGDSSADVLARWRTECPPRWAARTERRLVIGVGAGDVQRGITTARSRLNLANILDDAQSQGIAAFVVGTPRARTRSSTPPSRSSTRPRPTCAHAAASRSSTATSRSSATTSGPRTSTPPPTGSTRARPATA
ncbi:hypothetical protein GCM10025862_05420 [Arsenicicoccus piscis]|uniref:SGNH hydrolase-type esterase domain-containing protein n=1 Tax=Arsenicicoccus piscis TaxID=673954 RepID=A0ABQ6HJ25_9MICO|nr:hypothetical protein GCM10025862_05420 [Arsenicicoccus piscis]